MIIVWDEPKRIANIAKHGIDFADVDRALFSSAVVGPAKVGRYFATDGAVTVIFAWLGSEAVSIVSARPASTRERRMVHG